MKLDLVETDDDEKPVAVFEGRLPSRRERASIQRHGYGLNLVSVPDRFSDLAFLEDYSPFLRDPTIISMNVTDACAVLAMPRLEKLSLQTSQRAPLDLRVLTNLLEFGGQLRNYESVLSCPQLRRVYFQEAGDSALGRVRAPLEILEIVDLKSTGLDLDLDHPSTLKNLSITGADRIDVQGLGTLQDLEVLELAECTEVIGLSHLASLGRLRVLVLESCPSLDVPEALLALDIQRIAIVDKNPLDATFRREAAKTSVEWVLYFGSARRMSGAEGSAT